MLVCPSLCSSTSTTDNKDKADLPNTQSERKKYGKKERELIFKEGSDEKLVVPLSGQVYLKGVCELEDH